MVLNVGQSTCSRAKNLFVFIEETKFSLIVLRFETNSTWGKTKKIKFYRRKAKSLRESESRRKAEKAPRPREKKSKNNTNQNKKKENQHETCHGHLQDNIFKKSLTFRFKLNRSRRFQTCYHETRSD